MNTTAHAAARKHLRRTDPVLRELVDRIGPCTLKPKRDRFATLVHSIVSQQVSGKAARAIYGRLRERLTNRVTPESLAALAAEELRSLGVSRQKASYLLDLACKTRDGEIHFRRFGRMADEEIIEELIQVRGIGRWTAQMLLIFSLGRLDVLPVDDFGIRSAIQRHYHFSELPHRTAIEQLAVPWRPFASIACWYLWRSLDNGGQA